MKESNSSSLQRNIVRRENRWKISLSLVPLTIICFVLTSVESQNLDINFPLIYEDPQKSSALRATYFGYSVLLYSDDINSWIQISAPRANDSLHSDILEPGLIYRCSVGNKCSSFIYEQAGNVQEDDYYGRKDQQWLGGTMAINREQDLMVVCAPRWVNQIDKDERLIEGVCYTAPASNNNYTVGDAYKILPLIDRDFETISYETRTGTQLVHNYGLGQAGMSAYFPKNMNSTEAELILGAPGILNWQGSVILLQDRGFLPGHVNKRSTTRTGSMSDMKIPLITSVIKSGSYFGYSVTAGRFFSNELFYVASAPRGYQNRGLVIIFRPPKANRESLKIHQTLYYNGEEVGGYYGAALEVADLNNDGFDDLLISAPMLRVPTVFICNGGASRSLRDPISGLKSLQGGSLFDGNSRFGLSISAIDLDLDTYKDVLVGAPFAEDGHGAVALWKGGFSGLQGTGAPAAIYRALDLYPHLRGFGMSISPPVDIDRNLYPDVAVGSFVSGHVVILRGRPVIKFDIEIGESMVKKLLLGSTNFTIPYCIKCISKILMNTNITVDLTLSIDNNFKRAYLEEQPHANNIIKIKKNISTDGPNCDTFHILLNKKRTNFLDPIDISINITLVNYVEVSKTILISNGDEEVKDDFDKTYPIADRSYTRLYIPFETECGADNVCEADLNVNIEIIGLTNKFILGSSKTVQINITVANTGEPSYVTQFILFLPPSTALARLTTMCENKDNNSVLCNIDNPLKTNISKSIVLDIDMHDVSFIDMDTDHRQYLTFTVETLTQSIEINPENNKETFQLFLDVEASVAIIGKTSQNTFSYEETDDKASRELVKFQHLYEIQKFGASPIERVALSIKIPYAYKKNTDILSFVKIYKPEGYQDGQQFFCGENDLFEKKGVNEENSLGETSNRKRRDLKNNYIINITTHKISKKQKRSLSISENNSTSVTANLPKNRTIVIDCDQENVLCTEIICFVGPFRHSQTVSRLLITMKADISAIKNPVMGAKDILVITSQGSATILDIMVNGSALTNVSSNFVSSLPGLKVALWLIILCIVLGLLLLSLLIYGLTKTGFFERKKKDELSALKKAEETENNATDADWFEESDPNQEFAIDNVFIR